MYKNINDYEQLYLVNDNDDYAKELIFKKYTPIIISIAKKYYSLIKNRSELDDFIQEGYIGLNRAINSFNEQKNVLFYTFSLICIERQIRVYYNRLTSLKNHSINNSYSLDLVLEDKTLNDIIPDKSEFTDPDLYLQTNLYNKKLILFKNNLEFTQSLVFELRYNGFKYKEIAELLDISISIVDNHISSYRKKWKMYMNV